VRRLLVLALLALAAAACGSSEPEAEAPGVPGTTTASEPATTTEPMTTTDTVAPPATDTGREGAKAPPGIPAYAAGYRGWVKLNDEPIPPRESDPHNGTKNVYASHRPGANGLFPNGTVVVKEAKRPGADFIGLIATMRKKAGADPAHNDWVFVEFTREAPNERYSEIASGAVCWSCHVGAETTDYVFTLGG
jgi:hypothetical protein